MAKNEKEYGEESRGMRILVACEFSQIVTKAFRDRGHEAYSCDLLPTEGNPDWHIQGDVLEILDDGWDLMIAHPPCTYLSYAGIGHWNKPGRLRNRLKALSFFADLWLAPIEKICIENPKGCASPTIAKYNQEVQPYYFGDIEQKTTWLWLKNLCLLEHYKRNTLFEEMTHTKKPEPIFVDSTTGHKRYFTDAISGSRVAGMKRSRFWPGIAKAMAEQWG
jgi:site-specific DNA-cytosine methylase